jgi:hypothetical protein
VCPRDGLDTVKRKKSLAPSGNLTLNPWSSSSQPSCYNELIILAPHFLTQYILEEIQGKYSYESMKCNIKLTGLVTIKLYLE